MKRKNGFFIALAAPGILWLVLLFIVPFYAVLAIAMGKLNELFGAPVAVWTPFAWNSENPIDVWHDIFGSAAFAGPIVVRTIVYVAIASLLCLLIGYPAAYFVARFAGRRKGLFLVLLIAPFWISYMMRMLAWIDLLQANGYVNKILSTLGITSASSPIDWLGGKPLTVILGLVYGYIPYLILVLYAGLDRIDPSLIEAGRGRQYEEAAADLGANRWQALRRVILPLLGPAIFASAVLVFSGVIDDFVIVDLLSSNASNTPMSVIIYSTQHGGNGGPALNALGTIMLVMSLILGAPRRAGQRHRGADHDRRQRVAEPPGPSGAARCRRFAKVSLISLALAHAC